MLLVPRPADRASLQFFLSCTFLNPPELQPQARNDAGGRANDGHRYHEPPSAREVALPTATVATVAERAAAAALDLTSPAAANVSALRARAAEGGAGGAAFSSSHHRHDNSRKPQLSEPGSSRPSARSGSAEHQRRRLDEGHGKEERQFSDGAAADTSARERSRHDGERAAETTDKNNAMMAPVTAATSSRFESTSSAVERDRSNAHAAAGRDGEWVWNWGHDSPAVIGVRDEGPLPSLPALPFALGPVGGRRSFGRAEDPTGDGGGGGSEATPEFTFDLAFAASPEKERPSPAAAVDEARERRTLGANHTLQDAAPAEPVGPDWTRRKRNDVHDNAAKPMESSAGEVAGAATLGTPNYSVQRHKSFPGEGLVPMSAQAEISSSLRRQRSGSGTGSRAQSPSRPSPEPVFYLGQGGSLLAPNASPTRRQQTQSPGVPPPESPVHRSRRGPAGQIENSTPPSPAYFTSTYDGGTSQSSPGRGYQTPPISAGSQPGSPQFERSQQPHVSVGGGPSTGDTRSADGGTPMLIKYPSFRVGGDSLLTIPEDSTGFVLVTRPSSISCEHGPQCECWAWSATQGGGGAAAVRSPSASYLATANPYGGPGKAAAADRRQGSGGVGPSFLGLGTIWNTAVNTFRGVAGAHARRASWPRRTSHASPQQQQRASLSKVQSPRSAAVPGGMSSPATAAPATALSSSRENQSPQTAHQRKMGGAGSPGGGDGVGNRSGIISGGGRVSGSRNGNSFQEPVPSDAFNTDGHDHVHPRHSRNGSGLSSPTTAASPQTTRRRQGDSQQELKNQHHRSHSHPMRQPLDRPTVRQSYPSGLERRAARGIRSQAFAYGAAEAAATPTSYAMNHREIGESRRVQAAADRAEVVGKRAILVVTLADKTAQEAMILGLDSPRDAHSTAESPGMETEPLYPGLSARRRHDMLTESLSLYVKALAMLQAALPGVLVECDGVPIDELAAWNPLGLQNERPRQHSEQSQRPPSSALLAQRAALVTKASWLKELFSQTLQRAEHCRAQASAASAASAAATATAGPHPATPKESLAGTAPWSTLDCDGAGTGARKNSEKGGRNGTSTSDTAAIAVYRSAVDHGEKAAVCYLLGRSDTAIAHYVRACALFRLLALEPEMAFTSGGPRSPGCGGNGNGRVGASPGENERMQGLPGSGGWRARMLVVAEEFARRVEHISNGIGDGPQDEGTQMRPDGGGGGATVPADSTYST